MSKTYHIVVCGSVVPDPLQRLEPVVTAKGHELKNEMLLPVVLDPWAAHSLYEAAALASKYEGSKIWLLSLGPRAKLQQLMMSIAQKVPFELVAIDSSASAFTDSIEVAKALATAIRDIQGLDFSKLLLFGGWESASRSAGSTLQCVGEALEITQQFQGVDKLTFLDDGTLEILERIDGGKHRISKCTKLPVVLGWATGFLPEPPNNPSFGMKNMRLIMPALQRAKKIAAEEINLKCESVSLPSSERETKIIKNIPVGEMAKDILNWIKEG